MTAALYRTNTGAGVVRATPRTKLSDCLQAPTSQPRGPIQVQGLRIGNDVGKAQGSKVGVFIYCQEHAREWGTPLVCLETAERLVRNYGSDPETTALIDGLDIFLIPSINADGATYSMFDFNSPAPQHGQLLRVEPDGQQRPVGAQRLGRRPQPQLLGRLLLRRLRRRVDELHQRHVRRPVRALRARDPQRDVRPDDATRTSSSR